MLTSAEAVKPGAPLVFDAVPNNIALDYHYGDAAKVADAFAKAKHVTRLATSNQRMIANAMEPRAAIAEVDAASGKWTLYSSSQGVFGMKTSLMDILGAPADKVRVVTGQVGGSFGMKAAVYPEYVCILHGARMLGRPVKWTDERSGSFLSDHHGRAQDMTIEIAFDEGAHILAIRLTGFGNMGGYLAQFGPLLSTGNQVKNIASVYRTPLIEVAPMGCAAVMRGPVRSGPPAFTAPNALRRLLPATLPFKAAMGSALLRIRPIVALSRVMKLS